MTTSSGRAPALTGRAALVTGGTRGLGLAIARTLCSFGADVMVNYAADDAAAEAALAGPLAGLPGTAAAVKGDIGDPGPLRRVIGAAGDRFGRLDIFVHNAAAFTPMRALTADPAAVDRSLSVALAPLTSGAALLADLMAGRPGRIIAVSSSGAGRVVPGYAGAGVAKAALEAMVRYLAVELAGRGIAVNAVSTAKIDKGDTGVDEKRMKALAARTPAGRLTVPDDVAGVVALLCTDEAAWIHGQVITVDGGFGLAS